MDEEARKRDRQWGWALLMIAGICFMTAVCGYSLFDDLERTGGSIRTTRRIAAFYETFGKAGFPIIFGGAGLICCAVGVWKLAKSRDHSQHSKERKGGFGSSVEKPPIGQLDLAPCPHCGRDIKAGASFCKHCKTWLS